MTSRTARTALVTLAALVTLLGARQFGDTSAAAAETLPSAEAYELVDDLFAEKPRVRRRAARRLIEADDPTIAPALMDAVFFNTAGRAETVEVLVALLGVDHGEDFRAWLEEIGKREDIEPKPGYREYKAGQLARIDPAFGEFLSPDHPLAIRPEEIVWGGVRRDGIPDLQNPKTLPADQTPWLADDEPVFGVFLEGQARAYPRRILDWHEMTNDVVAGRPVTLSWCTLCGSGILYDGRASDGETYTFGTSGLLYRSNKLMYDRRTESLWSNLSGEPVGGPLMELPEAERPRLDVLPMVVTTWGEWRARHPGTDVLSLDTGHQRDYRPGAAYGEYFASRDLMFPVWKRPERTDLERKDWIWAVKVGDTRRAYPLADLLERPLVHDTVAGLPLVLLTDPASEAVRAYERGERTFTTTAETDVLEDTATGHRFRVTEDALVPVGDGAGAESLAPLPRRAGQRAFWFGWYAFFPDTELWEPDKADRVPDSSGG